MGPTLWPTTATGSTQRRRWSPGLPWQSSSQTSGTGRRLPTRSAAAASPVFADLGHLHGASATIAVAARADLVVVVSRPDMASVVRVRERLIRAATDLARMRGTAPRLFPLLVSTSRHGQADVADLSAVLAETPARPFLVDAGFLAHDPAAVRRLEAGEEPAGRLARTALMRTARLVASQIERIATAPAQATAGSASGAGS